MTSNVGTRQLKDFGTGVGFSTKNKSENKRDEVESILDKELKKRFAPEFINRLDEITYFKDLSKEDIIKILKLELNKSVIRLEKLGFKSEFDESIIEKLTEVGYDPQYGARPMKRAIQRWIDDSITDTLLENPPLGSTLIISYDKESDKTKIELDKTKIEKVDKPKSTRKKKDNTN